MRETGLKVYRRSVVVKASYRRSWSKIPWKAHARYLTREHAQTEHERGIGFYAGTIRSRRLGSRSAGKKRERRLCRPSPFHPMTMTVSICVNISVKSWPAWNATSGPSWNGPPSTTIPPIIMTTFIC